MGMNLLQTADYLGISLCSVIELVCANELSCRWEKGLKATVSSRDADAFLESHNTISRDEIHARTGASLCI